MTQQLQKDPFRLLFPIGGLLLVWTVAPWAAFGLGVGGYQPIFHAVLAIEGFLTAFALGFLFTFIPRKTSTPPPSVVELAIAALAPLAVGVTAWFNEWAWSQAIWIALMLMLARFVGVRMLRSRKTLALDGALVWVPVSLAMGIAGAALTSAAAVPGAALWLHPLGQALLTQGMFTGLALGIGSMLAPVFLHGAAAAQTVPRGEGTWALHLSAAVVFATTFALEIMIAPAIAWALRAAVALGVVLSLRLWRRPTTPGFHRRMLWASFWMFPLGFALMATFPARRLMGEHVVFIGGFALMVIAISSHVVLSHGGYRSLLVARPWQLVTGAVFVAVAIVARAAMVWDPMHLQRWAAVASISLLIGVAAWMHLLLTRLRPAATT